MTSLAKADRAAAGAVTDVPTTISWFDTAMPDGAAYGIMEHTTWSKFAEVFRWRREGDKDGCNFIPATFAIEADGRRVRRLQRNLTGRTAVALDIETNKVSGGVPPSFDEAVALVKQLGWGAVIYTSHNHRAENQRYRIVLPLPAPISHDLPAPEVVAERLGLLGVLDMSKVGAQSLFYLPSCEPGMLDDHETVVIEGEPIDADWLIPTAGDLLAARRAEAERIATEANEAAAARLEAKIAAGFDPDDSLIEKLRSRFDLESVLLSHGYEKQAHRDGDKYRHSNSTSGSFGANIKVFGGIERIFSHNGTDPLHATNLPTWCAGVTALDVFDVVTILDFACDRKKALHDLAQRFNLTKAAEKKAVAMLLFRMIREQAAQQDIEAAAITEGNRLGLSRDEVFSVATWVAAQATAARAA